MAQNDEELKNFNHDKAEVADKIALIGELEHIRRHALRSAVSLYDENDKEEHYLHYLLVASEAKQLRRQFQKDNFGDLSDPDWCLCKSAATLRQMAYELDIPADVRKDLDDLVDNIWGTALNMDLLDCVACKEDREA